METINPRSSVRSGEPLLRRHVPCPTGPSRDVALHLRTGRASRRCELEERSPHPLLGLADDLPDGAVGEAVSALLENVFGYQDYVIVATK